MQTAWTCEVIQNGQTSRLFTSDKTEIDNFVLSAMFKAQVEIYYKKEILTESEYEKRLSKHYHEEQKRIFKSCQE